MKHKYRKDVSVRFKTRSFLRDYVFASEKTNVQTKHQREEVNSNSWKEWFTAEKTGCDYIDIYIPVSYGIAFSFSLNSFELLFEHNIFSSECAYL